MKKKLYLCGLKPKKYNSMKTRPVTSYRLQFTSDDDEIIMETITTDDIDCSIEEYIEDREDQLYNSTNIDWSGEIVSEEAFRL